MGGFPSAFQLSLNRVSTVRSDERGSENLRREIVASPDHGVTARLCTAELQGEFPGQLITSSLLLKRCG
jgi:hypothetical protein